LYLFIQEKTEVEGSLFLYSRNVSPIVIIFIMNRLNKENTRLPLTSEMEIKVQQPYLLCKLKNSKCDFLYYVVVTYSYSKYHYKSIFKFRWNYWDLVLRSSRMSKIWWFSQQVHT